VQTNENGECHIDWMKWGSGTEKKTSKVFKVPGSTLRNKVNSKETDIEKLINSRLGRKPISKKNLSVTV
jgi:hypothetical protein